MDFVVRWGCQHYVFKKDWDYIAVGVKVARHTQGHFEEGA